MAGVEKADVERFLSASSCHIPTETKYKIAVTATSLRFFLKELEP